MCVFCAQIFQLVATALHDGVEAAIPGDNQALFAKLEERTGVAFLQNSSGKRIMLGKLDRVLAVHTVLNQVIDRDEATTEQEMDKLIDDLPPLLEQVKFDQTRATSGLLL